MKDMHRLLIQGAVLCALGLFATPMLAQDPGVTLGRLSTGATVRFVKDAAGSWGIDVTGSPHLAQTQPAQFEIYTGASGPGNEADVSKISGGYQSVTKSADVVTAVADMPSGTGATFHVEDHWSVNDAVLSLHRHIAVIGNGTGGFDSAILLNTAPEIGWSALKFMVPGKLYGDSTYDGATSPGGPLHDAEKFFSMRETVLAAPLIAANFTGGASVTVLDTSPKGGTSTEEVAAPTNTAMVDEHFTFGALGARQTDNGVAIGFWLPGTISDFEPPPRNPAAANVSPGAAPAQRNADGRMVQTKVDARPAWRRRYNPIRAGFIQDYDIAFRFGERETFPETTRNAWRFAWDTLKPQVHPVDIDYVRRISLDVLSSQVRTVDGRAGIPYLQDARTGQFRIRSDAKRAAMGFCAKNIEVADEFLKEADRDPGSARSQKLRQQGLDIIATFIRMLPMAPPKGDGFDIFTGEIIPASWSVGQQALLPINTDMRDLTLAYEREKKKGIEHSEWLAWIRSYADWELTQQHEDGSFPRAWIPGTSEVFSDSPSATYGPIVLLVPLARVTGETKYMNAALRAGENVWRNYGIQGNYQGGAIDASSSQLLTDKEGGMAALDAFMALYEATHDKEWLTRALSAADFTESWIWIWDVPLPGNEADPHMRWRNGPMVGLQGITANGMGIETGGDEYLDWAVSLYARAYKYSGDAHYLGVTRILLYNTKAKMATPRDTFDFVGPGWEQEGWNSDPGKWLPWLGANHVNGIMTLEEFDPDLFKKIAGPE
jgi:hypothetical protein